MLNIFSEQINQQRKKSTTFNFFSNGILQRNEKSNKISQGESSCKIVSIKCPACYR